MHNLKQNLKVDALIGPQVKSTAGAVATPSGNWREMGMYRKGLLICSAVLSEGKTAVCQGRMASAADGSDAANLGDAVTLTGGTGGSTEVALIPFDVSELDHDAATVLNFVGVTMTTNEDGDAVSAVLIRDGERYGAVEN